MEVNKFILGSHNTMTYRPVRQWYFRPFVWTARCQCKNLVDLFFTYKVRLFDIRVKYTKNGDLTYAHGPIQFCGHVMTDLRDLNDWSGTIDKPVFVRILLESNHKMKDQDLQEEHFIYFCENIEKTFKNLIFFGGQRKYDWKTIYNFKSKTPTITDRYSSTTSLFGNKGSWVAKLDDLWPWLYAKIYNKKNIKTFNEEGILLIDFVNIQ